MLLFFIVNGAAKTILVSSASEIETAMQSAQPGDTLLMKTGLWVDERIKFEGHGSQNHPIVLRAESPGSVVLNGYSNLRIAG